MSEEPLEEVDPFSPDNIGIIQFIQLSRIYDVLICLLTQENSEMASELLEMHKQGVIVSSEPIFTKFLSE